MAFSPNWHNLWPGIRPNASAFYPRQVIPQFSWSSIAPSPNLTYTPCYSTFQCARLTLSLDWTTPNSSSTVTIAITTLPASVPPTDPSFGGTVIFNPGGPGVSGISTLLALGPTLQDILDGEKRYEVLAFDPRGVGQSVPRADCYAGGSFRRAADVLQNQVALPLEGLGLHHRYRAAEGLGKLCETAGDNIFNHMNTASVARDMLAIVDALHAGKTGKGKLQYWGFSYGTFLGNVFASLHPERVGRMVLDGIGEPNDLLSGMWKMSTKDAEAALDHFYRVCVDAGVECPLFQDHDDVGRIRRRVDGMLKALEESPVATTFDGRVDLVSSHHVRETIRNTLYAPLGQFPALALTLANALRGNYTRLLAGRTVSRDSACGEPDPSVYSWIADASVGIFCGDTASTAGNRSLEWAEEVVRHHETQSFSTGEAWARFLLSCVGWPFKPRFAFSGPFGSSKTVPLLLLSTRHDPATPLENAYAVSRTFKGSVVVIQESVGHTTLISSRSRCTEEVVRRYFETGEVPANGTVCRPDCVPKVVGEECS